MDVEEAEVALTSLDDRGTSADRVLDLFNETVALETEAP